MDGQRAKHHLIKKHKSQKDKVNNTIETNSRDNKEKVVITKDFQQEVNIKKIKSFLLILLKRIQGLKYN
jgi:hypothetical protein